VTGRSSSCWITWLLAGSAIGIVAACASHGSSVEGQVIEVSNPEAPPTQWTRVPSAGAYVIVEWTGMVASAHARTTCLNAAIGRTDERGRFNIAGWWAVPKPYPVYLRGTAVTAYKPGFTFGPEPGNRDPDAPVVRTLAPSKLPVERRLEMLARLAERGCPDRESYKSLPLEDPQGVAASFYRALYDDAMSLGPLPPKYDGHLRPIREKAGIPEPPEPAWKVQILRPGGPQPAAPAPAAPDGRQ